MGTSNFSSDAVAQSTVNATFSRKPWIRKTPVEIVLGEIGKQGEKVAPMRREFAREERELTKLQQAKKVLGAL